MKLAVAFVAVLFVDSPSIVIAAPKDKSGNTREIIERVKQSKENLLEAEAQKRRVLGSLYVINQRMKKISSEKSHLTDELFHVQDNVKNIARIIAALEIEIDKQRKQLKRRLRALYKLSGEGYLGIIFSRASAMDLDESLRFLRIVTENDYRMIKNYQENVEIYRNQRKKLKGQIERLVTIEKKIKRQEGLLAEEHRTKSKIVSELDVTRRANLDRIKVLRGRTVALDDVDELLKPSIFEKKGQLLAPISGEVTQDFGLTTDDKYKIRLSHKGWRFFASQGTAVTSVFDGVVAFSGLVDGYGNTVIVDHGDHYYSVYSHISRVRAKLGDSLKQGQTIGEAGIVPEQKDFGIYFELRHFSEPEDPARWIAADGLKISPTEKKSGGALSEEVAKATLNN